MVRIHILFLVFMHFFLNSAFAADQCRISEIAQRQYQTGQIDLAIKSSLSRLSENPSCTPIYSAFIANCFSSSGLYDSASKYYKKAWHSASKIAKYEAAIGLAKINIYQNNLKEGEIWKLNAKRQLHFLPVKKYKYYFVDALYNSFKNSSNLNVKFKLAISEFPKDDPEIVELYLAYIDSLIESFDFELAKELLNQLETILTSYFGGNDLIYAQDL